jgi:hypothetical protein
MHYKGRARRNGFFTGNPTPKRRLALQIGSAGCARGGLGHILRTRMAGRGRPGKAEKEAGAAGTAARLRHDLGKYIRLSAPASIEDDTEALRARLAADVLSTRTGPGGAIPAAEVFRAWMREGGNELSDRPRYAEPLRRIRRSLETLETLSRKLATLSRPELERLDGLTRAIAEECRALTSAGRETR